MQIPLSLTQSAAIQKQKARNALIHFVGLSCLAGVTTLLASSVYSQSAAVLVENRFAGMVSGGVALLVGGILFLLLYQSFQRYNLIHQKLISYDTTQQKLSRIESVESTAEIQFLLSGMERNQNTNELIEDLLIYARPLLNRRLASIHIKSLKAEVEDKFRQLEEDCYLRAQRLYDQHPLVIAEQSIKSTLPRLKQRRNFMSQQWDAHYASLSWWNKMNADSAGYFKEIDEHIKTLTILANNLRLKHKNDLEKLDQNRSALLKRSHLRLMAAKKSMEDLVSNYNTSETLDHSLANKALLFSAMSVPVSAWSDIDNASNIYGVLRQVNGRYADSSDVDIWWDTVFMPAESLAGLTALTKGAYFEHLVANDTGGELHQHFNTPDTDITIDDQTFQIKATDSESYIASVDENIPVIATSEVAAVTDAIDGGYSNEELTTAVDGAIGGTIVDLGDTSVDAVLSGLGGLGLFATLRGITHASKQYDKYGDAEKAILEGAEVAVVGTARAMVNTAEMGYNAINSAPSRFLGRTLLKGAKALDRKLSGNS